MNETFVSLEAFRAAKDRRQSIEMDLGNYSDEEGRRAEVRLVSGTREVYAFFHDSGAIELLGQTLTVELADALLRRPGALGSGLDWVRQQIAAAPTDPDGIRKAIEDQRRSWGGEPRPDEYQTRERKEPMGESYDSLAAFLAADERRRSPGIELGTWLASGDEAIVRYIPRTKEAYARFRNSGRIELLGQVESRQLADALVHLPASDLTGFDWIEERIATAPTDPDEIATVIEHQRMAWEAYEQTAPRSEER